MLRHSPLYVRGRRDARLGRNTAAQPQGDDKRDDDCEGGLHGKRGDHNGDVEDELVEGDLNQKEKVGDVDVEDKRGDGEDNGVDVEGELFKYITCSLSQACSFKIFKNHCYRIIFRFSESGNKR